MPRCVEAPVGFHIHVCSLQAISALAAITRLDPDYSGDRAECFRTRARLSKRLLRFCDELYDSSSESLGLTSHVYADAVWSDAVLELDLDDLDPGHPYSLDNVTVFISIVNHINWKYYAHTDAAAISRWIAYYIPAYAERVFSDYFLCRTQFMDMLSRIYKHPHLSDDIALSLTMCLINAGVPKDARECIAQLNRHFESHIQMIMGVQHDPVERLSVAIKCGLIDQLENVADAGLISANFQTLITHACRSCDLAIFRSLWHSPHRPDVTMDLYATLLTESLTVQNYEVVHFLFQELDERRLDYGDFACALWIAVVGPRGVDILLQRGCPFDLCLLSPIFNPATLQQLISRGICVAPGRSRMASEAIASSVAVVNLLLPEWKKMRLPCIEYLCDAIVDCRDPRVLRELVDTFDAVFSYRKSYDRRRREFLTSALSYRIDRPYIRCIKICLRLGADVNAQDPDTGRTLLTCAVMNQNRSLVGYLLRVGASGAVRDIFGNTALDYFDAFFVGSPRLRERLVRSMIADV